MLTGSFLAAFVYIKKKICFSAFHHFLSTNVASKHSVYIFHSWKRPTLHKQRNILLKIGVIWGRMFVLLEVGANWIVLKIRRIAQSCFTNVVYLFSQIINRMVIYFFMRLLHHQIYFPPGISTGLHVNLIWSLSLC